MANALPKLQDLETVAGVSVSELITATETHFGVPVIRASCPGGRDRAIFRVHLEDRTLIASRRRNTKGAAREKRILEYVAPCTDHFPQLIGEQNGFLFQTDMGSISLASKLSALKPSEALKIFDQAIVSVFNYQLEIGRPLPEAKVPVLFAKPEKRKYFCDGPIRTAEVFGVPLSGFEPDSVSKEFNPTDASFLKWDNRVANASVATEGTIGWFDFEDSFVGAGFEDLAWIAADEFHAFAFSDIYPLFAKRIEEFHGLAASVVLRRFNLMTTLLIALRTRRIGRHLLKRGRWYTRQEIEHSDRVGAHPTMLKALLLRGMHFAELEKETLPLVQMFDRILDQLSEARLKD
ncbi:hypothetical protein J7413_19245 [Shimia sp. R10_1]|uniref:hypothetical protein n=1 Tax=Shimia sp. R10_1 TaxID=2821095 RepID=UPI001ADBD405|nr:hypothetical protein [Shimia sp. R10_1]MBO9475682.1 hypothetical protein [Shimia sp. R10_1]